MQNDYHQNFPKAIHSDFLLANHLAYEPNQLNITNVLIEKESTNYGGLDFNLNGKLCKFRAGKITPKKAGFFFTIWKRLGKNPIMPYDLADPIDFFVFSVHTENHFGQFVFPKIILFKKGILSKDGKGGKRAIRVYPPWIFTKSAQAKKSQTWQTDYFFEIPKNKPIAPHIVQKLYN